MSTTLPAISSKPQESRRSTAERKAEATNRAATEIIDAETTARERKTARLRAMRIEKEEAETVAEKKKPAKRAPAKGRKKKVA